MAEFISSILIGLFVFIILGGIIAIAVSVVLIIGRYKLFVKAGVDGWKAIIPFYSSWTLVEIAGLDPYWFALLMAEYLFAVLSGIVPSLAGLLWVASIATVLGRVGLFMNLSKKMHKEIVWVVLGVFFQPIILAVLGFDKKSEYDATVEVSKDGILENVNK